MNLSTWSIVLRKIFKGPQQIIADCRNLTLSFEQCRLKYVWKEANRYVDFLPKMGRDLHEPFVVFTEPPLLLKTLLADDFRVVFFVRGAT